METSEDEERKKREEAEKKKGKYNGMTKEQYEKWHKAWLEETIDVELTETETVTMLVIPGIFVNQDSEEDTQTQKLNKEYKELQQNKIGSDSYMNRGS